MCIYPNPLSNLPVLFFICCSVFCRSQVLLLYYYVAVTTRTSATTTTDKGEGETVRGLGLGLGGIITRGAREGVHWCDLCVTMWFMCYYVAVATSTSATTTTDKGEGGTVQGPGLGGILTRGAREDVYWCDGSTFLLFHIPVNMSNAPSIYSHHGTQYIICLFPLVFIFVFYLFIYLFAYLLLS